MFSFPSVGEIKVLRKRLGITQQQLAKAAGVSQSFVAKVEYGEIGPSYSKAVALFEALEMMGRETELTAKDVMKLKIISMQASAGLKSAVSKFKENGISQMPVVEGGVIVGMVSEADVLEALVAGKAGSKVSAVMEAAPPVVPPQSSVRAVSSLLRYCPLVVVAEGGRPKGVITRADLLEPLYSRW